MKEIFLANSKKYGVMLFEVWIIWLMHLINMSLHSPLSNHSAGNAFSFVLWDFQEQAWQRQNIIIKDNT